MSSSDSETEIYWDDLPDREREILNILEEDEDPVLSLPEVADRLSVSKQTASKHLDRLLDKGLVEKKDVGTHLWWIAGESRIRPGSSRGLRSWFQEVFTTETASRVENLINRAAATGVGLCVIAILLITVSLTATLTDSNLPLDPDLIFVSGYVIGSLGVLLLSMKVLRDIVVVVSLGVEEYRKR